MEKESVTENAVVGRRAALAKLGLGVAVAYTAPTILHLDRSAQAVQPSCNGKSKGNPWCTGGGGGSKSKGKGKG